MSPSKPLLLVVALVSVAALVAPVAAHAEEGFVPAESSALAVLAQPAAPAPPGKPARRRASVSAALDIGTIGFGVQLGFRVHYVELTVAANSSVLTTSTDLGLRLVPFPGGLATPYLFARFGTVESSTPYGEQVEKHNTLTGGMGGEVALGASHAFLFADFGLVKVVDTETEQDSLNFTDPTKDDDRPAPTRDPAAAVDFRIGLGARF